MARTNGANWFATTLTGSVSGDQLTADVDSTGGISAPCYIVFRPRDPDNREVWLASTVTATRFEAATLSDRYLDGSAKESGQNHDEGHEVWSVPLYQHVDDIWDELEALDSGKADDPHGNEAHNPNFATEAHDHDSDYEADGAVATHNAATTSVHGIADTSELVTSEDVSTIVKLTESEYGALDPADEDTLYVVTEDPE